MQPFTSSSANFVFALCKPGEQTLPALSPDAKNITEIVSFALRNGVAPWCFYQLQNHDLSNNPELASLKDQLKGYYLQSLLFNRQRWEAFQQIRQLLSSHSIETVPLKGLALAFSLYPEEALRPMGDIDLLIPSDQIYTARDLLLAHGATPLFVPLSPLHERVHAHISALSWKGIMMEPHQRLFGLGSAYNPAGISLFEHLHSPAEHPNLKVFDDELMTYHLATHLIKGYNMGGMRLSWLLDIALILQRNRENTTFKATVANLHPPARQEVTNALQWASMLLEPSSSTQDAYAAPFPKEILFVSQQNTAQKHKKIVLNEIAHLPGIKLKAIMLFRELFPTLDYMNHQYGNHKGLKLAQLYLKRMMGQIKR